MSLFKWFITRASSKEIVCELDNTGCAVKKKDVWSVNKSKKDTKVINLKLCNRSTNMHSNHQPEYCTQENLSTAHYNFSSKNLRLAHVSPVLTFSFPNIYFALKKSNWYMKFRQQSFLPLASILQSPAWLIIESLHGFPAHWGWAGLWFRQCGHCCFIAHWREPETAISHST